MILECLTTEQQLKIAQGKCPDCGGRLVDGQQVGDSASVRCKSCGGVFWVGYPRQPKRIREY